MICSVDCARSRGGVKSPSADICEVAKVNYATAALKYLRLERQDLYA